MIARRCASRMNGDCDVSNSVAKSSIPAGPSGPPHRSATARNGLSTRGDSSSLSISQSPSSPLRLAARRSFGSGQDHAPAARHLRAVVPGDSSVLAQSPASDAPAVLRQRAHAALGGSGRSLIGADGSFRRTRKRSTSPPPSGLRFSTVPPALIADASGRSILMAYSRRSRPRAFINCCGDGPEPAYGFGEASRSADGPRDALSAGRT